MTQPNKSDEAVSLGSVQYFDGEAYVSLANVTEVINEVDRRHASKLKEAVREEKLELWQTVDELAIGYRSFRMSDIARERIAEIEKEMK